MTERAKILIVEDEKKISDVLRAYLEREGYGVTVAESGSKAIAALKDAPDLVVLDLMLPDIPGEDLCELIRRDSDVPIIMLTAKSAEEDRIKGLGLGADDYVVKPFSPRELVARVKARLRRTKKSHGLSSFEGGSLLIDAASHEVKRDGRSVPLTLTEFRVLAALAERPGMVMSRLALVNLVLGYDFEGYERTVDAHIKNLRRKIEKNPKEPSLIKTVYGLGYRFEGKPDGSNEE